MPRDRVNLAAIKNSLFIVCTECGEKMRSGTPGLLLLDRNRFLCPKCGKEFIPASKKKMSTS
jgi:predicted RNA-binding Zn-ribbon protein involved in translation (DUF1610 family)